MATYYKTLARIPNDIFLDIFLRKLDMGDPRKCICGRAVLNEISRRVGTPPENIDLYNPDSMTRAVTGTFGSTVDVVTACVTFFGGTDDEWKTLFYGVCDRKNYPEIESAIVRRLDRIVK